MKFNLCDKVQVMTIDEEDVDDLREYIGEYGWIAYIPNDIDGFYLVEFDDLDDSEFYEHEIELAE
jgi:hypothetical protein